MTWVDLLLEDGFDESSQGFFSRTLWFMHAKCYPTVFNMLLEYTAKHQKSTEEFVDYDVFLVVDPYERDFHMDLMYQERIIESFDPSEKQRVQQYSDLISDVAYSVAHAVPF